MPKTLKLILALAIAYALTGWLSLQIAVPPGYAAPVFPPAGIALSALLIYGYRVWPGVLAGSLAVQIMAGALSGVNGGGWWGPLLIPLGVTGQALFGAWLAQRLVGFPNALDTQKTIVRFLGIVAPVGCLIGASFAIGCLLASGNLHLHDALFNWCNWWVGDTLGVLVLSPLIFVFLAEPRQDWQARRIVVAVPLLVALVVLAFSFVQVRNWEDVRVKTQFNRDAENLGHLISNRFAVQLEMMRSLERLMSVSNGVDRTAWHDFVTPWLERYPGSQNFGWSPYVRGNERAAFEARISASERPDFHILDREPGGKTFVADIAEEYLPILYIEPLTKNQRALGLNPLSLPSTARAIATTRNSGQPSATDAFRLVQENGSQRGVVVYQAAFDLRLSGQLRGVISGVFRMDDAIRSTLQGMPASNIDICVTDLDGQAGNQRLSGSEDCDKPQWQASRLTTSVPIMFAGRRWLILLRANDTYMASVRSWAVWTTLAIGLGMVGILGAFLLITTGRTRRIEELVSQRTNELALASERLFEQQAVLAQAQRIARMGSWELNVHDHANDGQVLTCSDELRRTFSLPEHGTVKLDDLMGRITAYDRPRLQEALGEARSAPNIVALDCSLQEEDGTVQVLHFQIESEWHGEHLQRLRGTVQNVTDAREAQAHIQYLARYDGLTGLPNRMHWIELARAALNVAQRHNDEAAVLFLDLDNFKTVNDSLGHPIGDRLLSDVATRLAGCLREEDTLGRLGGDEFVVLLPRLARAEDAAAVAHKLIGSLITPIFVDHHELRASVSIGIAMFPSDGLDVDTLLKHADVAMYGAKQAGRNNFQFFVPEMNIRATERLQLDGALRHALERNELVLHYQPQLDVADGVIHACEALVRWQHPERGLIPPMQFIPMAEDSGLILPLGDWIIAEACRQQASWAAEGLHMHIAINISALQFQQTNFAEKIARIINETGADPRAIELEITESALMTPTDELIGRLARIGSLGVSLALDDFGTGYSSLAYLKRLPIERLKLDRSFVRDLPGDLEDAAIAAATLSLARDLGMQVVAEGVETDAQQQFLAERGCEVLQGFLIAKPMPAEAFATWLRDTMNAAAEQDR